MYYEEVDVFADIMPVKGDKQVVNFCRNCQCKGEAKNKDDFIGIEDQICIVCKMTVVPIATRNRIKCVTTLTGPFS